MIFSQNGLTTSIFLLYHMNNINQSTYSIALVFRGKNKISKLDELLKRYLDQVK